MATPTSPTAAPTVTPTAPTTPSTPTTPTAIPVTGPITLAVSGAVSITLVPAIPPTPAPVPVTTTTTTTTVTTGPSTAPAATPAHAPTTATAGTSHSTSTPTHHRDWTKAAIVAALLAIAGGAAYCELKRNEAYETKMANIRAAMLDESYKEGKEALKPTISVEVTAQRVGNTAVVSLKNTELTVDSCGETHPATIKVLKTSIAGNGVLKTAFEIEITAHGSQKYRYKGTVMSGRAEADAQVTAHLVE